METEERMEALELRGVERVVRDGMVQEFKVPTVDLSANPSATEVLEEPIKGFLGIGTTALMEVLEVALEQGCIPITKPSVVVAVDIPVVVVEVAVWVPVVEVETSTRAPMFHLL
jgi:hypothetical protein